MSSASIVAAFVALFVVAVSANSAANCPNVTPKANLESARLSGQWYGVYGNNVGFQSPQIRCLKGNFQVNDEGIFTSSIEFIKDSSNDHIAKTAVGTPVDGNKARLHFVNSANPAKTEDTTILDTDYDHYMIWITCMNKDGQTGYNVAVTSRQQSLSAELLEEVKQALRNANLDDSLVPVSHQNC